MISGWNLWVWLGCIGVISGCCFTEVYGFLHNITYPTPLVLAPFCSRIPTSLFIFKMFFCIHYFVYIYLYVSTDAVE